MARPLRIEYAGAWYHVMNRGSERRDIYYDSQHFELFLDLLSQVHERYQAEIHAYCLMDNHYHLLLHTPCANLSKIMQRIGGIYTQKINKFHNKDGALFRGRFKSILIDSDAYLLQVSRYIHLNPISAGMVEKPEEYYWSSYKYYINEKNKHKWLFLQKTLDRFGVENQVESYKKFVSEGVDIKIKDKIEGKKIPPVIGSPEFIKSLEQSEQYVISASKSNITVENVIKFVAKYFNLESSSLQAFKKKYLGNTPRKVAIYLSVRMTNLTHRELAAYFSGISERSIREVCRRLERELKTNELLLRDIKNIRNELLIVAV